MICLLIYTLFPFLFISLSWKWCHCCTTIVFMQATCTHVVPNFFLGFWRGGGGGGGVFLFFWFQICPHCVFSIATHYMLLLKLNFQKHLCSFIGQCFKKIVIGQSKWLFFLKLKNWVHTSTQTFCWLHSSMSLLLQPKFFFSFQSFLLMLIFQQCFLLLLTCLVLYLFFLPWFLPFLLLSQFNSFSFHFISLFFCDQV